MTTKKKDTVIEDLQKGLNAAAVIALTAATHAVENQHPQFLDEEKAQIIGPLSAALVSKIAVSELLDHLPK